MSYKHLLGLPLKHKIKDLQRPLDFGLDEAVNFVLEKILSGEEGKLQKPGQLAWYDPDGHPYFVDPIYGPVPLQYKIEPPADHSNESHTPDFLAYFTPVVFLYNAADVTVDDTAAVTLTSGSSTANRWNIPFAGIACRKTIPQDVTLEVWIEVNNIQRTAKYPVGVQDAKLPFFYTIAARDIADLSFWQTKFASAWTIALMGQVVEAGRSCIVSDRYMMVQAVG